MQVSPDYLKAQSSHQLYVVRTSSHTANQVEPYINSYTVAAKEAVNGLIADNPASLVATQKKIGDLKGWFNEYKELVREDIYKFTGYELAFQGELFGSVFIADYVPLIPTIDDTLKSIRSTPLVLNDKETTWQKMLNSFDRDTQKQISAKVNQAYFGGDINGLKKSIDSTMVARERQIKATTRTLYQHAASVTKQTLYKENDDIVIGYQIITTFDSRRSKICTARDNKVYYYKDSFNPVLPFHYNERSTDIPVLNDEFAIDESGAMRAARGADGGQQVRASTSAMDFTMSQPKWFQEDLLGVDRSKIFRNAGLTTEQMQEAMRDQFDRPITIEQMVQRNKKIMEYVEKTPDLERYL